MTDADKRLTKNERRAQAREQARELQRKRQQRERLTKGLTVGGIVLGAVAVIAIVALVIVNSIRPAGPGPENMASDGIVLGADYKAVETPALDAEESPTTTKSDADIQIVIYQDYMCPYCGMFETTNGAVLAEYLESGAATVEYHPISILDRLSLGTKYSTRAANAAACVAENAPDSFFDWNTAMYANQPAENTQGLSNADIIGISAEAGIDTDGAFADCVNGGTFNSWVEAATARFGENIPYLADDEQPAQVSTPTIVVNGQQYEGALDDGAGFQAFVTSLAGQATSDPSETAAPSDSATPSPSSEG